jgi:hypothetical protein
LRIGVWNGKFWEKTTLQNLLKKLWKTNESKNH